MTSHRDDTKEHKLQLDRRAIAQWLGAAVGGAAVSLALNPSEAHATDLNVLDVDTIDILRGLTPPQSGYSTRVLLGYFTPGDGGGGLFFWDPDSMASDNTGTVIIPDSVGPSHPGRWLRIFDGPVSARWFGAGIGGNDAQAIQNALDSVSNPLEANPRGGEVFVPKGLYILNRSLVIHSNCRLSGEGWGSILKVADNANPPVAVDRPAIRNLNFTLPLIGNTNIQIANLAIDGNNQNNIYTSYQAGIFLQYCEDVLIENVYVHHCLLCGIALVSCKRGAVHDSKMSSNDSFAPDPADNAMGFQGQLSKQMKVTNCHSEYNERYGFQFWGSNSDQDDNVIANCTTKGNKGNGYSFTGGRRNKIINCSSIEDGGGPILAGTDDSEVIGCTVFKAFSLSTNAGILVSGSPRTRVIGNSVSETSSGPGAGGASGISVDTGSTGSIIEGNHVQDNQGDGIAISNSLVTLSNNTVVGGGRFGMFVSSSPDTTVVNNRIEQAASAGIYVQITDRVSIHSNRIIECADGGILTEGSPKHLSIIGNHVSGCGGPAAIYVGKEAGDSSANFHRIENNLVINNTSYGIRVLRATRCVISGNAIGDDQNPQTQTVAIIEEWPDPLPITMENLVIGNQCSGQVLDLKSPPTMVAYNVT